MSLSQAFAVRPQYLFSQLAMTMDIILSQKNSYQHHSHLIKGGKSMLCSLHKIPIGMLVCILNPSVHNMACSMTSRPAEFTHSALGKICKLSLMKVCLKQLMSKSVYVHDLDQHKKAVLVNRSFCARCPPGNLERPGGATSRCLTVAMLIPESSDSMKLCRTHVLLLSHVSVLKELQSALTEFMLINAEQAATE